ncbi:MAG: phasin family protein [Betaproteobacteria bacterium]
MSSPKFEQMFVAQKASSELLVAIMRTSFDGMQRLAELNMAAAREVLSSTASNANALASSKDVTEMLRVSPQKASPERLMEYWRNVYDLVTVMQKDVSAVMQANYSELAKTAASAIEQKNPSAIGGSDMIASAMKDMLSQTNKAFDNMTAVAGQMASMAGANFKSAASTSSDSKASEPAAKSAKKK